ncbi:GNAT family N-acetyltransferase, partial [Planktotalea sp.]|uniref:GNAT family N-acetyltransferase n=1 Tax=Planktotalea sp. TaxID=2029877 RepID=UPI00329788A4
MFGTKIDVSHWAFPNKSDIDGRYIRLEPMSLDHLPELWVAAQSAPESFTYLRYGPFKDQQALATLIEDLSTREDQPFWVVRDETGQAQGWLSICDVYQSDGAFEIGSIWFAPQIQGTRGAREAIFLLMCLGMDDLGYERLVWRCQ